MYLNNYNKHAYWQWRKLKMKKIKRRKRECFFFQNYFKKILIFCVQLFKDIFIDKIFFLQVQKSRKMYVYTTCIWSMPKKEQKISNSREIAERSHWRRILSRTPLLCFFLVSILRHTNRPLLYAGFDIL